MCSPLPPRARCGGIGTARKDPRLHPELLLEALQADLTGAGPSALFRRAVSAVTADKQERGVGVVGASVVDGIDAGFGLSRDDIVASLAGGLGEDAPDGPGLRRRLLQRDPAALLQIFNPLAEDMPRLARSSCDAECDKFDDCCADFQDAW